MKKLWIILLIIIVFLLGSVAIFPLMFRETIKEAALDKANQNIDAHISFDDYSLSLFRSFPNLTATFKEVSLVGTDAFENDTLASFASLSLSLDFPRLIKKEGLLIRSLEVDQLTVHLLVDEEGNANWEIASKKQADSLITAKSDMQEVKKKELLFLLDRISLNRCNLIYQKRKGNVFFEAKDANILMDGTIQGKQAELDLNVVIPSIRFSRGEANYIEQKSLALHTALLADLEKKSFRFLTNGSDLNGLPLELEGGFDRPVGAGTDFDLRFSMPGMGIDELLAMLPEGIRQRTEKMDASGTVRLQGQVIGKKFEKEWPAIDINLNVSNGKLQYPGLPDAIRIDAANALLSKSQGTIDLLILGLDQVSVEMAGNPLILNARLSKLFSDPFIDLQLDGVVDLGSLNRIFPTEGLTLDGLLRARATLQGAYSSVREEDYTAFVSRGNLSVQNLFLQNRSFPQGIRVKDASLDLHNQDLRIWKLQGMAGKSDFLMRGRLANFLSYAMGDGALQGNLELVSNQVDLNEFIRNRQNTSPAEPKTGSATDSIPGGTDKVFRFPERMHLVFGTNINELFYDRMIIHSFKGKMELKNQQLTLHGLDMRLFDGSLGLNGTLVADGRPEPDLALNLNVDGFDLPSAWRDLDILQKYLPFAREAEGKISSVLTVHSVLSDSLKMILSGECQRTLIDPWCPLGRPAIARIVEKRDPDR